MNRIVWKMPDGSVQISNVEAWPRIEGETDAQHLARVAHLLKAKLAELDPAFASAVHVGNVPATHHEGMARDFRGAWTWSTPQPVIDIDMVKARDIQRAAMRRTRVPLLAEKDAEYTRADARGDAEARARIEAERQALRDVTADPAIETAVTPKALRDVWPAVLK